MPRAGYGKEDWGATLGGGYRFTPHLAAEILAPVACRLKISSTLRLHFCRSVSSSKKRPPE